MREETGLIRICNENCLILKDKVALRGAKAWAITRQLKSKTTTWAFKRGFCAYAMSMKM